MPIPAPLDGFRRWLRRVFFWLPSSEKHSEQPPEAHHDHHLVIAVTAPERMPHLRQFRYALRVFSTQERRTIYLAGVIALAALLTAGFFFARGRVLQVPVAGGTVTEALVGQPKYINPLDAILNDIDSDLSQLIYSGLFRMKGLEPVPDIAEQYSWSEDRKVLTIKLRSDARFHDGERVSAEDVRFTFDSLQDPARKSPLAPLFRGVTIDVDLSDPSTIRFTLQKPDPTFINNLVVGILPVHLWQEVPPENVRLSDLNIKPVGSGPYRVKSFLRDNVGNIHSYTLERFDHFYGIPPNLATIIFQFFPDQSSALDAFKSDLVDAVAFVPAGDAVKNSSSGRAHDVKLQMPEETVAFYNIKDKTLTKEVRQALTLAINRPEIISALHDSAEAVVGPYPFEVVTSTQPDVVRARELLTNAGWVVPADGNVRVLQPKKGATSTAATGTELAITINVPNEQDLLEVAGVLKRQWSLIGAKVTVEAMPTDELMRKATRARNAQVVLLNIFLGSEQDLFPFWWSGQATDRGLNFSNLTDRATDDALEATRNTTSTEALAEARKNVSATIQSLAPAAFLVRPTHHYLVSSSIKGVTERVMLSRPSERLYDMITWYTKTGWRWK